MSNKPVTLQELHDTLIPIADQMQRMDVTIHGDGNGGPPGLKSDFRVMSARVDYMCKFMWMSLSATLITLTGATVTLIVKALS
jgi:hypothetical protein